MPRGKRQAGVVLARSCRRCGTNEWRPRGRTHVCVECSRRTAREGVKRRRDALSDAESLWTGARDRAAASGQTFTITVEDIEAVWPADGRCPVTHRVLRRKGPLSDRPSLDRINNAWGYEPGNVAIISMRANQLKNDATASELEAIAAWMRSQGVS